MTKLDDLLRTLEDRAARAPDGIGLIDAAHRGAARVRRRRRIARVAVAAAVVAAIAVGVPAAVRRQAAPVVPAVPDTARTAQDMTLEILQPAHGLTLGSYGTSTSGQFQSVTLDHLGTKRSYDVYAYPPGTPDRPGEAGGTTEPIEVHGQPGAIRYDGFFLTLSWRYPDGTLISVRGLPDDKAGSVSPDEKMSLRRVAQAARVGRPRPVPAPIRFTWLPEGLAFTGITYRGNPSERRAGGYLTLTLAFPDPTGNDKRQVDVNITRAAHTTSFGKVANINGYAAWFGHPSARRDALVVRTPACDFEFLTSPGMSQADITRIAEESEFLPCDQPATWKPPMSR